jgi:hypothetical protein
VSDALWEQTQARVMELRRRSYLTEQERGELQALTWVLELDKEENGHEMCDM